MGKGKKKHNHNTERDIKALKRNERKNMALGTLKNININKYKNQNMKIPQLISQKQKIIDELNRKQKTGSRQQLIDTLNKKLQENNTSEYSNLYQLMEESKSNQNLYNKESDQNLLFNQEQKNLEKKLNITNKDLSRKAYVKILDQVIENSDVILEVLDSRDPLTCRNKDLENKIKSGKNSKKIILVLNKIDLIPVQNAIDWQKYLSNEFPCVLFKSNTQTQSANLSQSNLFDKNLKDQKEYITEILKGNKSIGGEELLNLLKNYSRIDGNTKSNIVVGVIGIPNVGKSSLINSLTRGKNVGVSNTPGFTKGLQEVILDNNIRLLDCPGVVMSNDENSILHNVIRTEDIKEPIEVVGKILKKMSQEYFLNTYNLDISILKGSELTIEKIVYLVGEKMKKYKKGGIVDLDKSARIIINDWNLGKLKYYSVPPGIDKNIYDEQLKKNEMMKKSKMDIDK
jgi:nuclear GTP-binding protein